MARATVSLLLATAVALLLIGVGSGNARSGVAGLGAGTTGACTADATKILVREFVLDYARARITAVDRLWAPAPRFQWFSTRAPGARLGRSAYDRSTLARYFRARMRAHERLRLIRLGAGYESARAIVNFAGRLLRSADDIAPRPPQDFKGAADCISGRPRLIVWSM